MSTEHAGPTFVDRIKRWGWISWRFVIYLLEGVADGIVDAWHVIRHEAGLFWGVGFFVVGLFGFRSGRYCDGNTAEYLSCTRPATFYYYDWLHIALIVLGVFLILVWVLKNRHRH